MSQVVVTALLFSHDEQNRVNADNSRDRVTRSASTIDSSTNQRQVSCPLCKLNHSLDKCSAFLSINVNSRWRYFTHGKTCFVCLSQGHVASKRKLSKRYGSQGCSEHKDSQKLKHSINATERVVNLKHQERGSFGVIAVYVIDPKGK